MLRAYLKSIADAIRTKLGITNTINAQEFPNKVNEVYEKGRTDEWSEFWDEFQQNGTRTRYDYAFVGTISGYSGFSWTDVTFKPKHDIKPIGSISNMFYGVGFTDFKGILERQGIVFDTSKVTTASNVFGFAQYMTHAPEINLTSVTVAGNARGIFSWCTSLEVVDKLTLREDGSNTLVEFFKQCKQLKEVRFGGVIGQDISFLHSPLLSTDTVIDAILHFKNYAGTSNAGKYLTLHDNTKTAMANLGAIPEFNNKTYDAYLADIGWCL